MHPTKAEAKKVVCIQLITRSAIKARSSGHPSIIASQIILSFCSFKHHLQAVDYLSIIFSLDFDWLKNRILHWERLPVKVAKDRRMSWKANRETYAGMLIEHLLTTNSGIFLTGGVQN